jgi:hypothetical protein
MNKYLLLRDDEQSGPFSLEQIKSKSLQPTDLIWVLGVSNGWSYATEVEELHGFIEEDKRTSVPFLRTSVPLNSLSSDKNNSTSALRTNYRRSLSDIKEMYVQHLQKSQKTKKYKLGLAAAVVTILLLGGLLIKKMVDGPKEVEIKVADIPSSIPQGEGVTNSENFQNALSKEFVPYEPKPKKAKPKDLKKLIGVEANDYHVRLLGGINDLRLSVQNYSEHFLDKIVIKVDYLKPKGDVVNSEQVILQNIKPMESKTIDVPPSARGVKIKYSIISVQSQEYKTLLEET